MKTQSQTMIEQYTFSIDNVIIQDSFGNLWDLPSNKEAYESWHAEHKLVKVNCTKKSGLKEHLVE